MRERHGKSAADRSGSGRISNESHSDCLSTPPKEFGGIYFLSRSLGFIDHDLGGVKPQ